MRHHWPRSIEIFATPCLRNPSSELRVVVFLGLYYLMELCCGQWEMCVYKIAVMAIINTQFILVNFMEENPIETGIFVNRSSNSNWL